MKLSLSNSGISNGLKWPYLKLLVAPTSHLPSFHGNIFLYSFLSPNLVAILDFASHDVTGGALSWLTWVLRRCKFRCAVSSTNDTCQHSNCVHFKLWKQYLHTQGLSIVIDSGLFISLKFSRFSFGPATAMKGLWGRHLVVFVGLFSVLVADKEFWWMGQEGTFGQGSNQVRNCENPIFSFRHQCMIQHHSGSSGPTGVWCITKLPGWAR